MTEAELPPLVGRTVQRLIRAFAPERILLFGSQAKQQATERSDYDLLVVAKLDGRRGAHERRARQLTADCFPPVDVVFATPDEIAGAAEAKSPFLLSILGSGVEVYRRETKVHGHDLNELERESPAADTG